MEQLFYIRRIFKKVGIDGRYWLKLILMDLLLQDMLKVGERKLVLGQ
jgi:hypothetical protein